MAIKGRSEKQKAALAEIVASETLLDIEEYIRPKFPPKRASSELLSSIPNVSLNVDARRRIVQDGHGRWREVKPRLYSSNLQSYPPAGRDKLKEQQIIKGVNGLGHRSSSSCGNTFGNYNNLSMSLRSNVFPGLGNNEWNSTTTKIFKKQPVIPSTERDKFFGIQTDAFGQWSAANVHHERMKKKWDAYLESLPKQAGSYKIPLQGNFKLKGCSRIWHFDPRVCVWHGVGGNSRKFLYTTISKSVLFSMPLQIINLMPRE